MAARHVVRGMTSQTFAPNDMVTRGQFTVMLVRTLGFLRILLQLSLLICQLTIGVLEMLGQQ
nr:S-layer homology domain-containing protein [Desulforamulus aquiferis]